jgi:hypothetical protein
VTITTITTTKQFNNLGGSMIYICIILLIDTVAAVAMYAHLLKLIKNNHLLKLSMLDRIYNNDIIETVEQSKFRAAQNALREQYYKRKKKIPAVDLPMWAGPVQASETTTPETERTDV